MRKNLQLIPTCLCLAAAGFFCPDGAQARELVFTASIESGAVVSEISDIALLFPGFAYIDANPETCEVTFDHRRLRPFIDYELMLTDGGGMFAFAFNQPLTAETPTELTLTLPAGCVSGMWEDHTENVANESPVTLSYTIVPAAVQNVQLSLTSVTKPSDNGELPLVLNDVPRLYNRFYLKADVPSLLAAGSETADVTLSGTDGAYSATAVLKQAYGTSEDSSYFYFDVEEAPDQVGDYTLTIAPGTVTDSIRLRNPEFGATNTRQEIRFKIVERLSGIEQVADDDATIGAKTVYRLDGVRISSDAARGQITVSSDGKKRL